MSEKKKLEKPEADELLKHGKEGSYDQAGDWYDAVQPHQDNNDMDSSWRLRADRNAENLAAGTYSEGLSRVALNERREDLKMKSISRKIDGIMGDLTEEEGWEVLKYGDTKKALEADAKYDGRHPKPLTHPSDDYRYQADEKRLLLELKAKYEPEMTEEEKRELKEREVLAKLKEKYGE